MNGITIGGVYLRTAVPRGGAASIERQIMHATTRTRIAGLTAITGLAGLFAVAGAAPALAETDVDRPDSFTSAYTVNATPDEVIDSDGNPVPGEEGATGTFTFMVNSDEEIICYEITLDGVSPPYESPAKTATHIHAAPAGEGGPPRIAFPNPEGDEGTLTSSGCLQGPFTTGLEGDDGADTGDGFSLKQLEEDPSSFSADTHTAEFAAGAVRGQLMEIPLDGVDTGFGGTADTTPGVAPFALGAGAVGAVAVGAVLIARRSR